MKRREFIQHSAACVAATALAPSISWANDGVEPQLPAPDPEPARPPIVTIDPKDVKRITGFSDARFCTYSQYADAFLRGKI